MRAQCLERLPPAELGERSLQINIYTYMDSFGAMPGEERRVPGEFAGSQRRGVDPTAAGWPRGRWAVEVALANLAALSGGRGRSGGWSGGGSGGRVVGRSGARAPERAHSR